MSGATRPPRNRNATRRWLRFLSLGLITLAACVAPAQAGTWSAVFADDFNRPNSPVIGNGWQDPDGVANLSDHTLKLTTPTGATGTDLRVSRPVWESSLNQRIEASFIMPATNDGISHSAFVRGKTLVIAGQKIDPVIAVSARHGGALSMLFSYKGGGGVYPYAGTSGGFVPVGGHSYTLAVQITNNFPSVVSATLTDNTSSTTVASLSFNDFGNYIYNKTHMSPDFIAPGFMGLGMEGPAGSSVAFTKVTTYEWNETGPLTAQFFPAYVQHSGKTFLASSFPGGGSGPYRIRWYRGPDGFVPPTNIDGSGAGSGTYLGNSWEVVDANPPMGVTNWAIAYRAVYFDSGANATTGVLGGLIRTNSPPPQINVVPFWIGDSITAGYATSVNASTKSPAAYAHAFLNSSSGFLTNFTMSFPGQIHIYGIAGRTSTQAVNGLAGIIGQARITGATFANIMLGTNDSRDSVATSPDQFKSNIQTIITALKAQRRDIRVVLNKPLWFRPDTGYGIDFSTGSLGRISQYRSVLEQLADGTNIVVGGVTASDEIQAHGWTGTTGQNNPSNATTSYPPAPTGSQSYLTDGLHPYDGGSEMIAKLEWGPNAMNAVLGNFTPIPMVNAGTVQLITFPVSSVTLTGSATNANGPVVGYAWTKVSGGNATISTPSSATTAITNMTEGSYVFRLTATNSRGASGTGDVTVIVRAAATYAAWTALNGLSGEAALPDADPDGNGVGNLVEYAFGIRHGDRVTNALPTPQRSGGALSITYRKLQDDITYLPEWSNDLASWITTGITTITDGPFETASILIDDTQGQFMRLRLLQN